ncbi:MFS transporter [Streptomyces sp. NPDC003753]|uniref:MFS transporter n=1 Tax=unclassified Streptomyces TaxID=2593676 RepID=UPI001905AA81|nr:MFS transporter [Streptomyces sp. Y2F8-2]GHK03651.1 MFS transporter [Streptomyces sp. Y2F8-2]
MTSPTASARTPGRRARRALRPGGGLPDRLVTVFAVAAGLAVANIYYAHPLLTAIASAFGVGSTAASLVVTASTAGYTLGLALLVPLGDMVNRRRLLVALMLVTAVTQAASAAAPSVTALVVLSGLMAVTAVGAPLLVAFAAALARPEQRGRVTGRVMSGVLGGVLLARTGAGLLAQWTGSWRSVFAVAAVGMLALAALLWRLLPDLEPAESLGYRSLLRSVASVLGQEPLLRLRCLYGFLTFASFSVFWASAAFLLAAPPYRYGEALIGAFGLLGAAGALAARATGPLVDRGRDRLATTLLYVMNLVAWALLALDGGHLLACLVPGVLLLDFGVQGAQVTNLGVLYRLRPEARNRITMAYMTAYFLGGAAGSALSGAVYSAAGWAGVSAAGGGLAALVLLLWAFEQLRARAT